jgi:hypothetical protein
MIKILPGDFFSTKGKGITGWINEKGTITSIGKSLPKNEWKFEQTDRFHFGIIADEILDENGKCIDYETRESISKGPSVLRFFDRYEGQDIELYRIPEITQEERIRLIRSISTVGAAGYGFKDFIELAIDTFMNIMSLEFPPYTPAQLKSSRNNTYICTELPALGAFSIHKPIEPSDGLDYPDIPIIYLQAIEEKRLIWYYKSNTMNKSDFDLE